ncbi:hypothetical protein ACFYWY_29410 [Streptomyces sp. NPDC002870]|uniref:hypothetical protein n=1 Tax=Streptomyces sp. NPDC002870 TaxID=3364666 RepID=UPI0036C1E73C
MFKAAPSGTYREQHEELAELAAAVDHLSLLIAVRSPRTFYSDRQSRAGARFTTPGK